MTIVVLLYTLAAYCSRRVSLQRPDRVPARLGGRGGPLGSGRDGPAVLDHVGSIVFAGPSLIAWAIGDSMRNRRAYYAALEDRAARLERERDAQAQIAAAAERARIARELHDVVAHNVSVMVVQADGASYALDRSPERARQALAAISSTGRQALEEMRRMLGVLRSADEQSGVDAAARRRPARRAAGPDPGRGPGGLVHRGGRAEPAAAAAWPWPPTGWCRSR